MFFIGFDYRLFDIKQVKDGIEGILEVNFRNVWYFVSPIRASRKIIQVKRNSKFKNLN